MPRNGKASRTSCRCWSADSRVPPGRTHEKGAARRLFYVIPAKAGIHVALVMAVGRHRQHHDGSQRALGRRVSMFRHKQKSAVRRFSSVIPAKAGIHVAPVMAAGRHRQHQDASPRALGRRAWIVRCRQKKRREALFSRHPGESRDPSCVCRAGPRVTPGPRVRRDDGDDTVVPAWWATQPPSLAFSAASSLTAAGDVAGKPRGSTADTYAPASTADTRTRKLAPS